MTDELQGQLASDGKITTLPCVFDKLPPTPSETDPTIAKQRMEEALRNTEIYRARAMIAAIRITQNTRKDK